MAEKTMSQRDRVALYEAWSAVNSAVIRLSYGWSAANALAMREAVERLTAAETDDAPLPPAPDLAAHG